MKKNIYKLLVACCVLFLIGGCKTVPDEPVVNEDAAKFKEEYEAFNGKKNSNDVEIRSVSIDSDNPFIYISPEDVVEKIENEETFYLYVGDKQCPWCRSSIEKAIEVAKKNDVKEIYYIHIWDDEHNEILRDKYTLDSKNKPSLVSEGTEAYKKLLEYFDEVLSDYTLTTSKGKTVEVGEKRIFAPNYFYIKDGKVERFNSGTSSLQKDAYEELTDEMLEDQEEIFTELFKK